MAAERIAVMVNAGFFGEAGSAKAALPALILLLVAGCHSLPKDPDSTLATIEAKRVVRVGVERPLPPEGADLLRQLEQATGAEARFSEGGVEPLLAKLDAGEIDLVVAPFGEQTPWAAKAALSPPLRVEGSGGKTIEWRAAMRSGENRWIMLVESRARRVSSAPDAS